MTAATTSALMSGIVTAAASFGRGDERAWLEAGDRAPDFSLHGSDGRLYRLADLVGRHVVVLAWFPKAFTGGCATECRSIGSKGLDLRRLDVRHFGASVDSSSTNARFAESLGIDYPILSDPTKQVARAYGVLGRSGYASRWTFYIGMDGRVLDIDRHVHSSSHGADVVAKLEALGIPESGGDTSRIGRAVVDPPRTGLQGA